MSKNDKQKTPIIIAGILIAIIILIVLFFDIKRV